MQRVCLELRRAAAALAAAALLTAPAARAQQGAPDVLNQAEVSAMATVLENADAHGLPGFGPRDLYSALTSDDAAARRDAQRALMDRVLAYAAAQRGMRVDPGAVSGQWHLQPEPYDARAELEAALAAGRLEAWLEALPPADARYDALVDAYGRYARSFGAADWPSMPDGPALEAGDSGAAVAALRARLSAEGFACEGVPPAADPALFDEALTCAVTAYQDTRGLDADGVVGAQTRAALNMAPQRRLDQIAANLERWRWLPRAWPSDRLEVNTGAAEAVLFEGDAPSLTTRIVAGKPSTPTPTFSAAVTGVVVNPPWNVPASIQNNELTPRERREPGYLASHNYVWRGGRLVQTPGDHNALGRVKLDMPNPYTVYLHDTPSKSLFENARRYYSHGCMRMQKPREMALALLDGEGWTMERLNAEIDTVQTDTIALQRPVPVWVYHHTAYVRGDGTLILQPDVYGWDARLIAALEAAAPADRAAGPAPETECAAAALEPQAG